MQFENHFSQRVIEIIFPNGISFDTADDLKILKQQWQNNLKSWHAPYTCIFDLRKININPNLVQDFLKLIQFFQRFHMKKIVGFKEESSNLPNGINFNVYDSYELACQDTNLSTRAGLSRNLENLRERIVIDNDFHAHVMEISFLTNTKLASKEDVQILRSKIKNILRQWHTPYSILINCVNLTFSDEAKQSFSSLTCLLKGFFCKEIIGYSPIENKENYPFPTFRSRHVAAGRLESIGAHSGDVANCSTRKQ